METQVILLLLGATVVASFSKGSSAPETVQQTFQKLPLDHVVMTHDPFAWWMVTSVLDCGRRCVGAEGCVMFTFLFYQFVQAGECLLYGQLPSPTDGLFDFPGARSYATYESLAEGFELPTANGSLGIPLDYTPYESLAEGFELPTANGSLGIPLDYTPYDDGICLSGYTYDMCGQCLTLVDGMMNYSAAQQHCHQLGQGQLTMTKTLYQAQCAFDFTHIHGSMSTYVRLWVAAEYRQQEGRFVWRDNSTVATDDPMFGGLDVAGDYPIDCLALDLSDQLLYAVGCHLDYMAVCETDLQT